MTDDQGKSAGGTNQGTNGSSGNFALKAVTIIVAALLGLGCVFGGGILSLFYFTDANEGVALKGRIQGTPAIVTYIGQLDDLKVEAGSGRIGLDVSGSKGSGYLWVETGKGTLANADWAILETNGKSYVVFGDPPADMGAELLPVINNASTEESTNDVYDSKQ